MMKGRPKMVTKRKVILITDGDEYAKRAVELVAKEIGGRCISMSQGNPSRYTGLELVELIKRQSMIPYWSCLMIAVLSVKDQANRQ